MHAESRRLADLRNAVQMALHASSELKKRWILNKGRATCSAGNSRIQMGRIPRKGQVTTPNRKSTQVVAPLKSGGTYEGRSSSV
jgi:hypothetical protein